MEHIKTTFESMSNITYRDVLLTSENYLKSNSVIDWNLSGKFLLEAVRVAQFVELHSIIGDCLMAKLQQLVFDNEIELEANMPYKDLLDYYVQPFLLYQATAESIIPTAYKVGNNFGVMRSEDEKAYNANNAEINLVRQHYIHLADVHKKKLQEFLSKNKSLYPELGCCGTNLYASDSSGIWLGGYRAKIMPKDCCGRK